MSDLRRGGISGLRAISVERNQQRKRQKNKVAANVGIDADRGTHWEYGQECH